MKCSHCDGTGLVIHDSGVLLDCPICGGSGEVDKQPAGIADLMKLTGSPKPDVITSSSTSPPLPDSLCNSCRRRRGLGIPDSCEYHKRLTEIRLQGVDIVVVRCEHYVKKEEE